MTTVGTKNPVILVKNFLSLEYIPTDISPLPRFTHLFGKSWASRTALPDSNHQSGTPRCRFRPLWDSDCYPVLPTGVMWCDWRDVV